VAVSHGVSFAVLLRRLRVDAGLTQEELARAAGLSYRSISDLERGINLTARKETARLLADALNLAGEDRGAFESAARGRARTGGFAAPFRPVNVVATATRTLPRDIASFTGREPELQELMNAVPGDNDFEGVISICAIGGMAGIGKTALAVHAAHQLAPRFPDGQIFLPLHGHTPGQRPVDPSDALASLLQAAGMAAQQIPSGLEPRTWLWRDHLASRRLLLVLDDAAGHEQIRPLLPGTAGTLVLVTSRRHLTALEDAQVISLDTLSPDDAVALLVRLAGRLSLDSDDDTVREITRLCGCLPLAIGMLARQLHHHPAWTTAELAADLKDAYDRLELMQAENVSVAAAFNLSYQDLTQDQQRLFRHLGLHPGTDIDAYAAAALDESDLDTARRHLAGLYDHYLLTEPTRSRYRMHDLISQHARMIAAADPLADRDNALDRLLRYYLHTARSADRHLARRTSAREAVASFAAPRHSPVLSDRESAIIWMEVERPNLHAVLSYAAAHDQPAYAIAIPVAMHGFLRSQGYWDQGLAVYQTAVAVAHATGRQLAQAVALTDLGDMQALKGDYKAATITHERALRLAREVGDRLAEANALNKLGRMQHGTGECRAAAFSLGRALELHRDLGDQPGEASDLNQLGVMQYRIGDYQAAAVSQEKALEVCKVLGDRLGQANAHYRLADVQSLSGDYPRANTNLLRALGLYRNIGYRFGEAVALGQLGRVQALSGEHQEASTHLIQALELHQGLGYRLGEADALNYLGAVQQETGNYQTAAASYTEALRLYHQIGYRLGEAEALNKIGALLLATAAPADACPHYEQALSIAVDVAAPLEEAHAMEGIGRCHLHDGDPARAAPWLHNALDVYQRIGSPEAQHIETFLRAQNLLPGPPPLPAARRTVNLLIVASLRTLNGPAPSLQHA
jgi:tetratricopeptide (TPR) repeat protein/transcriptional regulator with XRE-family HTH domain